jgi:uncharacterized damage-inducible protein DinB
METHTDRMERLRRAYDEAHRRFVARLEGASAEAAESTPADGGWSAAQIGWHVAAVDAAFADLIAGARPSQTLPEDFRERTWPEIAASMPRRLEASRAVTPPSAVRRDEVLQALAASAGRLHAAFGSLTPDRGSRYGVSHPVVGTVTLYQIGEWATAHTIRHNAQAKRILGA